MEILLIVIITLALMVSIAASFGASRTSHCGFRSTPFAGSRSDAHCGAMKYRQ